MMNNTASKPIRSYKNNLSIDEEMGFESSTPKLAHPKSKYLKKRRNKLKGKTGNKQKLTPYGGNTSHSPYKYLLEKFKNSSLNKPNRTKMGYTARIASDIRAQSPKKIFKNGTRAGSKSKQKTTSALTRWLQKLLDSHGQKTKERNIIDYFIYAIYTVLADSQKTRDRISS